MEVPEVFVTGKGEVAHLFESRFETGRRSTTGFAMTVSGSSPKPRNLQRSSHLHEGEKSFDTTREMMEMPRFGFGLVLFCFCRACSAHTEARKVFVAQFVSHVSFACFLHVQGMFASMLIA